MKIGGKLKMMTTRQQHISSLFVTLILASILLGTTAAAAGQTTLEITEIKAGIGKVSLTVKNTGNETATNITTVIAVTGGLLQRINVTKICSGCGQCNNTILPGATKTESTSEAGFILGIGPVTIATSAEALNAAKVTKTASGFVLGPFIIIK
jgi:hypothetical protein